MQMVLNEYIPFVGDWSGRCRPRCRVVHTRQAPMSTGTAPLAPLAYLAQTAWPPAFTPQKPRPAPLAIPSRHVCEVSYLISPPWTRCDVTNKELAPLGKCSHSTDTADLP